MNATQTINTLIETARIEAANLETFARGIVAGMTTADRANFLAMSTDEQIEQVEDLCGLIDPETAADFIRYEIEG